MNTQMKFNQVQSRIQQVKLNLQSELSELAKLFSMTELKNLEAQLTQLAMELMAERHSMNY
jgi:hypothetical protein